MDEDAEISLGHTRTEVLHRYLEKVLQNSPKYGIIFLEETNKIVEEEVNMILIRELADVVHMLGNYVFIEPNQYQINGEFKVAGIVVESEVPDEDFQAWLNVSDDYQFWVKLVDEENEESYYIPFPIFAKLVNR